MTNNNIGNKIVIPPDKDYGILYINSDGKLTFSGDMDKSAVKFFEQKIQPMIDEYLRSREKVIYLPPDPALESIRRKRATAKKQTKTKA